MKNDAGQSLKVLIEVDEAQLHEVTKIITNPEIGAKILNTGNYMSPDMVLSVEDDSSRLLSEWNASLTAYGFERTCDYFGHMHGYNFLCHSDSFIADNIGERYVAGTYYLEWPRYEDRRDRPEIMFKKEGGKFINDMFGVMPDHYIDTPENREKFALAFLNTPEYHLKNWYKLRFSEVAWMEYCNKFKDDLTLQFKDDEGCVIFLTKDVTDDTDRKQGVTRYLALGNWKRSENLLDGEYATWLVVDRNGDKNFEREDGHYFPVGVGVPKQYALAEAVKDFKERIGKERARIEQVQKKQEDVVGDSIQVGVAHIESISTDGLRTALRRYDENGTQGKCGPWEIHNGGYDRWWEICHEGRVLVACSASGEYENGKELGNIERERHLADKTFSNICKIVCEEFPESRMAPKEQQKIFGNMKTLGR